MAGWLGLFFFIFCIIINKNILFISINTINYLGGINFSGILLSSHSPPVTTPLEPCRVAPYVNVPALRNSSGSGNSVAVSSNTNHFQTSAAATVAFSAFDPALISAAHQVFLNNFDIKFYENKK